MGKTKSVQVKERKFDRNVEISAPILDPEIIKAIHTPPKGPALNIKHGGFKALLSDLNSQDSTDELMPLNDDHVPSYIGISCVVSGYSNYSQYSKKAPANTGSCGTQQKVTSSNSFSNGVGAITPSRSRATSPVLHEAKPQVCHITIDKNNIHSVDDERKELTEKLTASASERNRHSPVPCVPPTEDDRHHGAYVGARYCPLPTVSKVVNKYIPLLGIDDELDEEEALEEEKKENKVEHKIATLYGDKMVEDWKESMTHKAKKELPEEQQQSNQQQPMKNLKDLVTLKPAPAKLDEHSLSEESQSDLVNVPNVKVLANVEKQFLNKLLTDENPPVPCSHSPAKLAKPTCTSDVKEISTTNPLTNQSPSLAFKSVSISDGSLVEASQEKIDEKIKVLANQEEVASGKKVDVRNEEVTKDSTQVASLSSETSKSSEASHPLDENLILPESQEGEEHIEYEIRAQSPVDNQSSPIRYTAKTVENQLMLINEGVEKEDIENDDNTSSNHNEQTPAASTTTNCNKEEEEKLVTSQQPLDSPSSLVNCEPKYSFNKFDGDMNRQKDQHESQLTLSETSDKANTSVDSVNNKDGHYYGALLAAEKSFILQEIERAEAELASEEANNLNVNDETKGKVRSAIGKANLLISKKFEQCKELCEANINKNPDEQFATLNDDLAGFWDMLSLQIADVRESFQILWQLEKRPRELDVDDQEQPQEKEIPAEEVTSQTIGNSSTTSSKGSIKANLKPKLCAQKDEERRQRLQKHILEMKKNQCT